MNYLIEVLALTGAYLILCLCGIPFVVFAEPKGM